MIKRIAANESVEDNKKKIYLVGINMYIHESKYFLKTFCLLYFI
jgi:hypothetical protein